MKWPNLKIDGLADEQREKLRTTMESLSLTTFQKATILAQVDQLQVETFEFALECAAGEVMKANGELDEHGLPKQEAS